MLRKINFRENVCVIRVHEMQFSECNRVCVLGDFYNAVSRSTN